MPPYATIRGISTGRFEPDSYLTCAVNEPANQRSEILAEYRGCLASPACYGPDGVSRFGESQTSSGMEEINVSLGRVGRWRWL